MPRKVCDTRKEPRPLCCWRACYLVNNSRGKLSFISPQNTRPDSPVPTLHSSSCVWNPRVFADDARGWQCPFVLCLHPQGCLRRGVRPFSSPFPNLPVPMATDSPNICPHLEPAEGGAPSATSAVAPPSELPPHCRQCLCHTPRPGLPRASLGTSEHVLGVALESLQGRRDLI